MNEEDYGCLVVIAIALVAICFLIVYGFSSYECMTKAVKQDLQYSYGIVQGCMVREKGGKWIDYDRLRTMN